MLYKQVIQINLLKIDSNEKLFPYEEEIQNLDFFHLTVKHEIFSITYNLGGRQTIDIFSIRN